MIRSTFALTLAITLTGSVPASVTSPKQFFGHDIGADYQLPNYQRLSAYWKRLSHESDRMVLESIGKTAEGRDQLMAIVSSPENLRRREDYRQIAEKLCRAESLTDAEAKKLSKSGKAIVWIDGGLHATETLGAQQLIETLYQMLTRNDDEARRILDNVIILFVHANPDGMDLVSDWYMQEADPLKRNMRIPRLYQKYIGHDNNRDFYFASQPETQNMCRVMYRKWYPQIVYNHHQTGPRGTVLFCPPFRDPFNHNLDAQVITGTDLVGMAMHDRFLMEGKPGATMRSGTLYSTWWNGGLRTTAYFHNMIGILTETIGSPTPSSIPFVADKISPKGSMPFPPQPQEWHFRQSIDYSLTANLAILDLAARRREEFLYGIYAMGRRQVDAGRRDTWIDYPSRAENAETIDDLRKPSLRAPRAYVLPSDQRDFGTAVKFANCLLHTGVVVDRAKAPFSIGRKRYPAGSLVIRCDQAFRPHILDMFEPQDHPNDIPAPGASPIPPYDSAGYTLAYQMGVDFVRLMEPAKGDFEAIREPMSELAQPAIPTLAANDSYKWAFDQLRKTTIYQTKDRFVAERPTSGEFFELGFGKVGLWDTYGGSMESGWTRWVFDQFHVPYSVLYPRDFDASDLWVRFNTIVLVDGAVAAGDRPRQAPATRGVPSIYHHMLGAIDDDTIPNLRRFLEHGGTIVAVGRSTGLARKLGLPLKNHLLEDGKALPRSKFYVPGSILQVKVDTKLPITWGTDDRLDVMFDDSPVFDVDGSKVRPIAEFDSAKPLRSGWAWGQKALKGGVAMAEAKVGKGKLVLFGPVINHRGQTQSNFKLLFNAILQSTREIQRAGN